MEQEERRGSEIYHQEIINESTREQERRRDVWTKTNPDSWDPEWRSGFGMPNQEIVHQIITEHELTRGLLEKSLCIVEFIFIQSEG